MCSIISRWREGRRIKTERDEKEAAARDALERRVSRQLVELIAYMDRLGISHELPDHQEHNTGDSTH